MSIGMFTKGVISDLDLTIFIDSESGITLDDNEIVAVIVDDSIIVIVEDS